MNSASREYDLLKLLEKFIGACETGKYLQPNGKRIRSSSLRAYRYLALSLTRYEEKTGNKLRIRPVKGIGRRALASEKKYWNRFYVSYTDFLFRERGCYDNYAGCQAKMLRAFFNYLNDVFAFKNISFSLYGMTMGFM